jgi:hypothetical protein
MDKQQKTEKDRVKALEIRLFKLIRYNNNFKVDEQILVNGKATYEVDLLNPEIFEDFH